MNEGTSHDQQAWTAHGQQRAYRQLLQAFSYPGRIETMGGTGALEQTLATLLDNAVTLADPNQLVDPLTRQRLQTPMTAPDRANFIVADGRVPPAFEPHLGFLESPEHGATILLKVATLGQGASWQLEGPGIDGSHLLAMTGLDPLWMVKRGVWNAGFPLGVDLILIDERRMVALPRTTRITAQGEQPWAM